jgi:hypothetical protein
MSTSPRAADDTSERRRTSHHLWRAEERNQKPEMRNHSSTVTRGTTPHHTPLHHAAAHPANRVPRTGSQGRRPRLAGRLRPLQGLPADDGSPGLTEWADQPSGNLQGRACVLHGGVSEPARSR